MLCCLPVGLAGPSQTSEEGSKHLLCPDSSAVLCVKEELPCPSIGA